MRARWAEARRGGFDIYRIGEKAGRVRCNGITTLDGTRSCQDTRVACFPVGRPENRYQAAEVSAFHFPGRPPLAPRPQGPGPPGMDELSKLSGRPGAAVDLVERPRSFNLGVAARTWASPDPDDTSGNRRAGTVGIVVVHQLNSPTRSPRLPGSSGSPSAPDEGTCSARPGLAAHERETRYVVDPDEIRSAPIRAKPCHPGWPPVMAAGSGSGGDRRQAYGMKS